MGDVLVPFRRNYTNLASTMVRRMFRGRPLNAQQRRDALGARRRASTRGRRAGGRSQTMRRQGRRSSAGVLGGTNADMRSVYQRKRMPKYKKKRWIRFVKKVNAVADKDLGLRTVLINDQMIQRNTTTSQQSTLSLCLYPFDNDVNGWLSDMNSIGQLENEANPTVAAGATISPNTKVMFQSAVMDITIRNTSDKLVSVDPGGQPGLNVYEPAPDAAIELDVYEFYATKDFSDIGQTWNSTSIVMNNYDDREIGGTGTGISINDRGASPFEFGVQMARAGIKITKKTKFFIPNGQTITWQARDPSRKTIHYGDLERQEGFNRKGWTKHYFLIYKLVPGLVQGNTVGSIRTQLSLGSTRKYSYKVEGFNDPRERLLGNSYVVSNSV